MPVVQPEKKVSGCSLLEVYIGEEDHFPKCTSNGMDPRGREAEDPSPHCAPWSVQFSVATDILEDSVIAALQGVR